VRLIFHGIECGANQFWAKSMSDPENDTVPFVPPHLEIFQATNGSRVQLSLISGEILDYRTRNRRKRRGKGWIEKTEHQIWLFLSDGREECLRVSDFNGSVHSGQSLTLVIGSNSDRDECVAIYNQSTAQVIYRKAVWGKLLGVGCLFPIFFILFVFPLIWLAIAMTAFKLALKSSLAVFMSPLLAVGITIGFYLLAILPVHQFFRRRIDTVLKIEQKT
jgi:hypothetical protein